MKRFITAAGAAVMALSCLTAAPVSADSRKDLIWQSAYQKVLTTYSRMQGFDGGKTKDSSGARWDLYDIDGDNMPELFISPDNSHAYGVMIYTCAVCKATKTETVKAVGHDWGAKAFAGGRGSGVRGIRAVRREHGQAHARLLPYGDGDREPDDVQAGGRHARKARQLYE